MPNQADLPNFGDKYLQVFNPDTRSFELRRKSRTDGVLSISEAMELVAGLLRKYQLSFVPNKTNKNILMLPFCFVEPTEGDKIRNVSTQEIYTVDQVIKNPDTGQWNGVVKLDLTNPPSIEAGHSLEYLNFERYVRFDHEFPSSVPNHLTANSEGIQKNPPPMFPTITWSVQRIEPGGIGKAFDSKKELKPRLRESTKDPYAAGYTVEIWGQWFDNIVQFDSWSNSNRTSERLIRWFEQFLRLYTGYIRQCGIPNLFFWRRDPDDIKTTWRQVFAVRSSQWYFRTEELEAVYQRDILKIDISLGARSTITNRICNEPRYIADQLTSGCISSEDYKNLFYHSGQYLFGDLDILQ